MKSPSPVPFRGGMGAGGLRSFRCFCQQWICEKPWRGHIRRDALVRLRYLPSWLSGAFKSTPMRCNGTCWHVPWESPNLRSFLAGVDPTGAVLLCVELAWVLQYFEVFAQNRSSVHYNQFSYQVTNTEHSRRSAVGAPWPHL